MGRREGRGSHVRVEAHGDKGAPRSWWQPRALPHGIPDDKSLESWLKERLSRTVMDDTGDTIDP